MGLRQTRTQLLFTCLSRWEKIGSRGIPSHGFPVPQRTWHRNLSLTPLTWKHINSDWIGVWDWCVYKQSRVRQLLINSDASSFRSAFFLFLLSDELRDERYDSEMTTLQNATGFVIRPLNSGLWALKKKEERRKSRPFFDISKRLSYFYLSTMNIFVDFRELPWFCFQTMVLDKDGRLSGRNVKCSSLFRKIPNSNLQ